MDILIVDLAYILTVGAPPKNMLPQQKVNHVVDKVLSFVNNTNCNKDIPISLGGDLDLNLNINSDCSCSNSADSSGQVDTSGNNIVLSQGLLLDEKIDSSDIVQFSRIKPENISDNPGLKNIITENTDNITQNITQTYIKKNILDDIKRNHLLILLQYFSERDNVFQLTEECRNMRKSLYDTGNLDKIELILSNEDAPFDLSDEYLELNAVHDNNISASIKTINGEINILNSETGFKKNDTLIARKNNNFYFFKVNKIKNLVTTKQINPMNWNIPIHTQIYRHFYPNSFDVDKINIIQNDLKQNGIEFVIEKLINEYYDKFNTSSDA